MYKILCVLICLITTQISSAHTEAKQPKITRVFFDLHSYICFDDKFYIHDPDCRCDANWGGVIERSDGKKDYMRFTRVPVDAYD